MIWHGYELETGVYGDHEYGIVMPEKFAPGRPFVWRTEFFGAFPGVDLMMLKKGYAVIYWCISDLYGCPKAVEMMSTFQAFMEEHYELAAQAVLFGFSRGGLYALHYAAKYPERTAALYLDAPVVDIYSWPGGFFSSMGAAQEWQECLRLWDMKHEDYRNRVKTAVRTLVEWSIPLVIVAGGKDEIVPYRENGALLQAAYGGSGAAFWLIMKPECGHHPHGPEDSAGVAEFLLQNRNYPTCGNALRINDQAEDRYSMTLIVHDAAHLDIVKKAGKMFERKCP